MNRRNPICPRCKVREKRPGCKYCAECKRELQRKWDKARSGDREKICPLCGKSFVAPGKQYCEVCRKLSYSVKSRLMKEKLERERYHGNGKRFAGLLAESSKINFRYAYGCGILAKKPEEAPPEKRELTLSDFVGRDNEPSIFQHL